MEIKGVSQSPFYNVIQGEVKKKNDYSKGILSPLDYLNQLLALKLDKEKNFSKISSKEATYALDCRSVAKDISDLNMPLCDTGGGGYGGG